MGTVLSSGCDVLREQAPGTHGLVPASEGSRLDGMAGTGNTIRVVGRASSKASSTGTSGGRACPDYSERCQYRRADLILAERFTNSILAECSTNYRSWAEMTTVNDSAKNL